MRQHKAVLFIALTVAFIVMISTGNALEQPWAEDPGLKDYIKALPLEIPPVGEDERREGYIRKEFEIPEGKIWKAVADVGSANYRIWPPGLKMVSAFYLNGQLVERALPPARLYCIQPVDITPYVQNGINCASFYGYRPKPYPPYIIAQIRIIMESGEIIDLNTDETWKTTPDEAEGWNQPGFDDSAWQNIGIWTIDLNSIIRQHQAVIPSNRGYLNLHNPARRDLFYRDSDEITVEVLVPAGLQERAAELEYAIAKPTPSGLKGEIIESKTLKDSTLRDGSLVYTLNLGKRERGVYTISLRLLDQQGGIIEERPREPLMVIGEIKQKIIEGKDYLEGLEVELEDEVDFTDPEDPHPNFETRMASRGEPMQLVEEPKIVNQDDLVYREVTGDPRGSGFSYRIEFKHPGDFYLLELEYPDDRNRVIEVSISAKEEHVWSPSQSGTGAETGGKFYNTNKMQKLRWIHVADYGIHSVDIVNYRAGWPAAAKGFKIYHIIGNLPALKLGFERDYGIHTERCYETSAFAKSFGVEGKVFKDASGEVQTAGSMLQRTITQLIWKQATCERYVQYLRFIGQNMHLMGCIQYHEGYNPFIPVDPNSKSPRIINCMKTVLANVMDANGLSTVAGIQFSQPSSLKTLATDEEVAAGADTMWYVNAKGQQRDQRKFEWTNVTNFQHPYFRQTYFRIVRDLANTFSHLEHFKGISNFSSPTGHPTSYYFPGYSPGRGREVWQTPLDWSYDDITFNNFFADTGIDLRFASNDPERFAKRAEKVKGDAETRQKFLDWRCQKLKDFFDEVVEIMLAKREDLQFINVMAHIETREAYMELMESGRTFAEMMKDFGLDIKLLSEVKNTTMVRWTLNWRQAWDFPSQNPYLWIPKENDIVISAFADLPRTGVLCRTSWDENSMVYPGKTSTDSGGVSTAGNVNLTDSDWIMDTYRLRIEVQPSHYHTREASLQAIITGDPALFLAGYTDLGLNVGNEQVQREVMLPFTHLPAEKFEQVLDTDLTTNLVIRKLNKGNESWMYIANPGYYHIAGTVELDAGGALSELVSGTAVAEAGKISLPVELTPFALVAYKVDSGKLEIASYKTGSITPHEIAHMTKVMDRAREMRPDDAFTAETIEKAQAAINVGEYATAWSMIKDYRFWPTY